MGCDFHDERNVAVPAILILICFGFFFCYKVYQKKAEGYNEAMVRNQKLMKTAWKAKFTRKKKGQQSKIDMDAELADGKLLIYREKFWISVFPLVGCGGGKIYRRSVYLLCDKLLFGYSKCWISRSVSWSWQESVCISSIFNDILLAIWSSSFIYPWHLLNWVLYFICWYLSVISECFGDEISLFMTPVFSFSSACCGAALCRSLSALQDSGHRHGTFLYILLWQSKTVYKQ